MASLLSLFDELRQQRLVVARLIEDAGYRAAALGLDNLGNPVTYQLAVGNRYASNLAPPWMPQLIADQSGTRRATLRGFQRAVPHVA